MKPNVRKLKNIRGRIVGFEAKIGPVEALGDTAKEASESCERAVDAALTRLSRGTIIRNWRGKLYVVTPTVDGWAYWIDGFTSDYRVMGTATQEVCENAALHHLGQALWSLDVASDEDFFVGLPASVREELIRWARWQRSYAEHRAAGMTDVQAHQAASS